MLPAVGYWREVYWTAASCHRSWSEADQPLVAGQDEIQRAHADEVIGEEPVEQVGVASLLGGGPALYQVEHVVGVSDSSHGQ